MMSRRATSDCPVCQTQGQLLYDRQADRLLDTPGDWSIRRCAACGLLWLDPRPRPEEIAAFYENYSTLAAPKTNIETRGVWPAVKRGILDARFGYRDAASGPAGRLIWRILSFCAPLTDLIGGIVMYVDGSTRGKLLDIGCGNGQFLILMKSLGWQVQGVEFDPEAAARAAEFSGAPVHAGRLEDAGLPESSFDVITLHHVVEHLHDPVATLSECRRILRPGGRIHLLTPNAKSLAHRVFKRHWRGLEVPRHLQVYTPAALSRTLLEAGFEIRRLGTTARSACLIWNVSRMLTRHPRLPKPLVISPGTKLTGLMFHLIEHFGAYVGDCGEEILAIGAVRKN